jgi:hypothetical protein
MLNSNAALVVRSAAHNWGGQSQPPCGGALLHHRAPYLRSVAVKHLLSPVVRQSTR